MKQYIDDAFLLTNKTAETLYSDFACKVPIIDYHCHIDPKEIAENRKYDNIAQMWLYHDHYKWRLMRWNGTEEYYITGEGGDREKFQKYAEALEAAAGNPLHHWSHLELRRYFGYQGILNGRTAEAVWEHCNKIIKEKKMNARQIIKASNVAVICTTDDPANDLRYHAAIREEEDFGVSVLPSWRPDKVMSIENAAFNDYIDKLSDMSSILIEDFSSLRAALKVRLEYFDQMGCRVSDHAFRQIQYAPASDDEVDGIFIKVRSGGSLSDIEVARYKTALMVFLGKEYNRLNWAMQLHFGAKRDNNSRMFQLLGPDTGFDCIGENVNLAGFADLLNRLDWEGGLPKTVLYSLNPNDNAAIGTIIGCFQGEGVRGRMQHGSAWWFNDNKTGMENQLISLANLGLIGAFIGMTTDSRSILSYTRHEYFRRILCNLLGRWAEDGEYPNDIEALGLMVKNISYTNCAEFFGFNK